MSGDLQTRSVVNLGKTASASPVGLVIDEGTEFDDWARIGIRLTRLGSSAAWWIGDWLAFGEVKYEHGRYKAGMEELGLSYGTLANYASVARRFESSRRREKLSFAHHVEVAGLTDEEQDRWLDQAEAGKWSQKQLRAALSATREPKALTAGEPAQLRLAPEAEQRKLWIAAAEFYDEPWDAWAARTLTEAASKALAEA